MKHQWEWSPRWVTPEGKEEGGYLYCERCSEIYTAANDPAYNGLAEDNRDEECEG